MGLFNLQKINLQGDPIAALQYLKEAYKKGRKGLFTGAYCDRMKGNRINLEESRLRLDIIKKLVRAMRHCREVMDVPSLEVFKTKLSEALSNLVCWKVSLSRQTGCN